MDPSSTIVWAFCLSLAWFVFASITGVDDWLKSLLRNRRQRKLEHRIEQLERRVDDLSRKRM